MNKIVLKFIISITLVLLSPSSKFAQFISGPSMIQARMSHYQVNLDNGDLWIVGGHGTGFTSLATAELFDINNQTFTLQNMNYSHDNGALVKMNDGKFLIAGGAANLGIAPGYKTAEIYDPINKTFTITGSMNYNRTNCYGTVLTSGKVLIAGGWYDNNSTTYAEIYDPNEGTFTSSPALIVPRANPMVFPTNDGGAIVFGGYEGFSANPFYQSVEYYDAVADSFRILQNTILPNEEGYYIAAIRNEKDAFKTNENKYIFGVYRNNDTIKEYVFLSFDPEAKLFSSLYRQPIPEENQFSLIGTVLNKTNNKLFCIWQLPTLPIKIGLGSLDLSTEQMSMPTEWYDLAENYYPGYSAFTMLNNNTILMSGGYSTPGSNTNFTPIDSTLLINLTTTNIEKSTLSSNFTLSQNYPNPFNPTTTIKYEIPAELKNEIVRLKVFDVLGNEIATLVDEVKGTGVYEVNFDAHDLSSGIYYYKLVSNNFINVKKMIVIK